MKLVVNIKDEFLEEFLEKLLEFRNDNCSDDCIKIFGLSIEDFIKSQEEKNNLKD